MRVEKETGAYIGILGSEGEGVGQFLAPYFTEYGPTGLLYVLNMERGDIQVFDSGIRVETKPMDLSVYWHSGIAIGAEDRMYIRNSDVVTVYSSDGLVSDTITLDTVHHTWSIASSIDSWRDPETGDDFIAVNSGFSVFVYRLEFVGW